MPLTRADYAKPEVARLHRIVYGQVISAMNDHPECYVFSGRMTREMIARGIAKRIVGELWACNIAVRPLTGGVEPSVASSVIG